MALITVIGNITRELELKYTQAGKPMVQFSVADNVSKDKTIFFDCAAFDALAERIVKFFKKGKPIIAIGKLDTREYQGKDGTTKTSLSIVVSDFSFLPMSNKAEGDKPADPYNSPASAPAASPAQQATEAAMPDLVDPFRDQ